MFVEFQPYAENAWHARVVLSNGLPIAGFVFYDCNCIEDIRARFWKEVRPYYRKAVERKYQPPWADPTEE